MHKPLGGKREPETNLNTHSQLLFLRAAGEHKECRGVSHVSSAGSDVFTQQRQDYHCQTPFTKLNSTMAKRAEPLKHHGAN